LSYAPIIRRGRE